jgi:hypothetical protein
MTGTGHEGQFARSRFSQATFAGITRAEMEAVLQPKGICVEFV